MNTKNLKIVLEIENFKSRIDELEKDGMNGARIIAEIISKEFHEKIEAKIREAMEDDNKRILVMRMVE